MKILFWLDVACCIANTIFFIVLVDMTSLFVAALNAVAALALYKDVYPYINLTERKP